MPDNVAHDGIPIHEKPRRAPGPCPRPMRRTLHLVRHGEVENPKGVIYGRLPGYRLSERGRLQARASSERLRSADLSAVWASPLERAQETAAVIAQPHELDIVTDERLIESQTTLEGLGREMSVLFRDPRRLWSMRNPLRPSWGEPYDEIRARMLDAIAAALEENPGREVALVSHQTPVRVARNAVARRRGAWWLLRTPCATGSVTTLVFDDERMVSASYFAPEVAIGKSDLSGEKG
jgi:broad specificity phosphatase PhoE